MSFVCKQVSADRWGIYSGTRLLATVSDRETCEAIMSNFESGRTKVPAISQASSESAPQSVSNFSANVADTIETPVIKPGAEQTGQNEPAATQASLVDQEMTAAPMSDEDLAKVLNVKSLKVKELESAVLRAQMSQKR